MLSITDVQFDTLLQRRTFYILLPLTDSIGGACLVYGGGAKSAFPHTSNLCRFPAKPRVQIPSNADIY